MEIALIFFRKITSDLFPESGIITLIQYEKK